MTWGNGESGRGPLQSRGAARRGNPLPSTRQSLIPHEKKAPIHESAWARLQTEGANRCGGAVLRQLGRHTRGRSRRPWSRSGRVDVACTPPSKITLRRAIRMQPGDDTRSQ